MRKQRCCWSCHWCHWSRRASLTHPAAACYTATQTTMQSKSKMQVSKQKSTLLHIPDPPFLHLEIGKWRGTAAAAASKGASWGGPRHHLSKNCIKLGHSFGPLLLYKKACVAKCCTYADFAHSLFLQLPALMCKGKMANVAHPQDVVVLCLRNKRTGLDKNEALGWLRVNFLWRQVCWNGPFWPFCVGQYSLDWSFVAAKYVASYFSRGPFHASWGRL